MFFLINKFLKVFSLYFSSFIRRNSNVCVFGAWWGEKFADNPKYLFMYCIRNGINAVWITKNESVYKKLKSENLPVAMAYSKEGTKFCQCAKYVFLCTDYKDVNERVIGGAYIINLWHGIPLKKVVYDDKVNLAHYSLKQKIFDVLYKFPYRNQYVVSTSEVFSEIYRSAFRLKKNRILQWGQPRNDCFFDGSIKKIRYSSIEYEKLIVYMPTHRNEGKNAICIEKILNLEILNEFCRNNKILFLIKKHFYHRNEASNLECYSNIVDFTRLDCDAQELMFNADVLITDYSSCYIDYLLLNRPILFYAYDYDSYVAEDREMYFEYDEAIPGKKIETFTQLMGEMELVCNGDLEWMEKHEKIKNLFYSKENQKEVSRYIMNRVVEL